MHVILCLVGVNQDVSRQVALGLLGVKSNVDQSNGHTTNVKHRLKLKRSKSVSLTESLLKAWRSSRCVP